jgi:hypothetical protein
MPLTCNGLNIGNMLRDISKASIVAQHYSLFQFLQEICKQ